MLAVGVGLYASSAGNAQAQVVITSVYRQIQSLSQAWNPYVGQVTDNIPIPSVEGSTNISTLAVVAGASGSSTCSQTAQILPLLFSSSNSVSASSDLSTSIDASARAYSSSGVVVQFYVTTRVRFTWAASATVSVDGYAGGSWGQYNVSLSDVRGSPYVSLLKSFSPAGSDSVATNLSGILMPGGYCEVRGEIVVQESVNDYDHPGTQSGNATCAYRIAFDPLPAGDNEILGGLLSGGDMRFTYVGVAGTNYALDRTFNLSPPVNWVPQMTNPADPSGVLIFTNTPNQATNNFWRIRSVP